MCSVEGDDSILFTVLLVSGTVAIGSVCTLDTLLTTGGTAKVGNRLVVCAPVKTVCINAGSCFRTDVLLSPMRIKAVDEELEMVAILTVGCWGGIREARVVGERLCVV